MGRGLRVPAMAGLALVLALGVVVRVPDLADPPLTFHPERQYHGLNNARRISLEWNPHASAQDRHIARLVWARTAQLEPPILEGVVAAAYRLGGRERLWIGPLLSMVAWTAGAVALFALARRLLRDELAALVAAAVMFLLPYTVLASTSFQPDPVLVALTVTAVWLIVRWDDQPSTRRLIAAALVGGFAALLKAVAAPYVAGAFVAVMVARHGVRQAVVQRSAMVFAAVAVAPAAVYYVAGVLTGSDLGEHASESVVPSLLLEGAFWRGWVRQIGEVTTIVLAVLALGASLVLAREQRTRLVLAALWLAYLAVGATLTYHTATHEYYHLPLVPIVGLGVGLAFSRLRLGRGVLAGVFLAALALAAVKGVPRLPDPGRAAFVEECVRIGELVQHSGHVVYVAEANGAPLTYHGRLAGAAWPANYDRLSGRLTVEEQWRTISRAVGGAEWFVVTDLRQLSLQPALARRLDGYRVAADDPSYRIYDLREHDG